MRRASLFALWLAVVGTGFSALIAYELTPGDTGKPPATLVETPEAPSETPGYTLVMAAHPRCPCTRASVNELAVLMTRLQGKLTATVWFYTPADAPADWARTALWKSAASFPGVTTKADPEGKIAAKLGAETSGHVLLFDPTGKRVFAGGITGARGHEGDNAGLRSVEALVLGNATTATTTPVFGCSILDAPAGASLATAANSAGEARR